MINTTAIIIKTHLVEASGDVVAGAVVDVLAVVVVVVRVEVVVDVEDEGDHRGYEAAISICQ